MKNRIISTLFVLFVLLTGKEISYAGLVPIENPSARSKMVVMNIEKAAKIVAYLTEIDTTLNTIDTYGWDSVNAAAEQLGMYKSTLTQFQDKLRIGDIQSSLYQAAQGKLSQVHEDALSQVTDLNDHVEQLNNSINTSVNQIDQAGNSAEISQSTTTQLRQAVSNFNSENLNKLKNTTQNVISNELKGLKDAAGKVVSDNANKLTSSMNDAAKEQALTQNGNPPVDYGKPQETIEKAQQYVKDTFFYSIREGDKYDGELIPDADTRHEEVQNRRRAYHQQVVADALAIAYESVEKKYDDSMKQLDKLLSDAKASETLDTKKATETAIVQADNRELMNKLSLEFAALELEVVDELLRQPENYLIARTTDEIEKETKRLLEQANLDKKGEKDD